MNDPMNHAPLSTGTMPLDAIDPGFDALDLSEDDYLNRCLFEIRESLDDRRNH